ncbi:MULTISPECIES: hypothetical protein [unclassified Ruegeria]|uniref:hypothetical protein n=1 Tax=unclassified Ruegeria TaxID=2625375 RepID=UPI001487A54C|nr:MULTISPECIES: hypothetical protein [unclassified Ruegeria]NOD36271.1 hypothetical protein [Ruegeria sp. HKCCD7296]NOD47323.1 hypothetical protein [Ruegeria sp. HKCCD5849]NOD53284.1 hypothetical protein [Ruegeria sp. HKCCD5851]NOD66477.1 hypothetical protein [Ruegeria sp. HKCCD7303]NOE34033.1 hypothetical protein [Ruegeria sp. HKCCD7318]
MGEPFHYYSVLAQYLNAGLLYPLEICRRVKRAYYDGHAPLNAVEASNVISLSQFAD